MILNKVLFYVVYKKAQLLNRQSVNNIAETKNTIYSSALVNKTLRGR